MSEKLTNQILDVVKKLHKDEDKLADIDNTSRLNDDVKKYAYYANLVNNDFNNLMLLIKFNKNYYHRHKRFYKLLKKQQISLSNETFNSDVSLDIDMDGMNR